MSVNGVHFGNQPIGNPNEKAGTKKEEEKQQEVFAPVNNETKEVDANDYGKFTDYVAMINSFGIGRKEVSGSEIDPAKYLSAERIAGIEAMMGELEVLAESASSVFKEVGFDEAKSNTLGIIAVTKDVNNASVVIQE